MEGFDSLPVFYNNCIREGRGSFEVTNSKVTFKDFLRTYSVNNFNYKYRYLFFKFIGLFPYSLYYF